MIEKQEYIKRIEKIRNRCKENNLDSFLVTSEDNLYYLTGKSCFPFERPFILIIWADKDPTYLLPRLELEHMSVIPHINKYVTYREYPAPEKESWQYILRGVLKECTKIGTDLYTRSEIFSLLVKNFNTEAYDWVYTQRFIKSDSEISLMKDSAKYVKNSMNDFINKIKYGSLALDSLEPAKKTQKKVLIDNKFKVDFFAYKLQSFAWPAPKSSEPHSIPDITLEYKDGPHVIIMSYRLNGYAIELERTFFTSPPTEKMKKNFSHMLKSREIAFSMLRPGAKMSDIDSAVRKYQSDNGVIENVIHRVGHGMGVSNHEGPFVAEGSNTILEEGMTITIEPGIYFEDLGAFRHSDTVVINKDGYENLTDFPDDIESLTITKKVGFIDKLKKNYIKKLIK